MHIDYGTTLYETRALKNVLPYYVKAVKLILAENDILGLVSTGSSGTILAAGVMLRLERDLCHIHVGKSRGHGGVISGDNSMGKFGNYIFLDDFIDTGASLERCVSGLCTHIRNKPVITHAVVAYICAGEGRDYSEASNINIIELNPRPY